MATTQIRGNASFTYTPVGGASTTHDLAVPLRLTPSESSSRQRGRLVYEDYNADGTERETFTIGNAYEDLVATVRFDDEPNSLRDMIAEGLEGNVTLSYTPDGGSTTFSCLLIAVNDGAEQVLTPDRERFAFGEWQVTLRLRVTSGTWDALL